ncbi:DDE superfamily endonuclease [Nitzschia inconspicua]|uniref:DDE superfamily endonuclease n=1 Tax=Nitzschia inconspicua TaxID=303405 RepID=A0A9K3KJH7_9STRA|nr:DDE superfamily endonuclease [Nitzschia inconspicua]
MDSSKKNGAFQHAPTRRVKPIHLLMGLHFNKCYKTEEENASKFGCDEKTFRQWSWFMLKAMAKLDKKIIKWKNRFIKSEGGNRAFVSIDGVHFGIQEPSPFDPSYKSHKLEGAAVAYELVVSIATGYIVGYNGPFPAGKWPDLNIFRNKTKRKLLRFEHAIADRGYRGDPKILTPYEANNRQHANAMSVIRARHETINRRLRTWNALANNYRHRRHDHHFFFRASIVLEQIKIENGNPPFQIYTYTDPFRF